MIKKSPASSAPIKILSKKPLINKWHGMDLSKSWTLFGSYEKERLHTKGTQPLMEMLGHKEVGFNFAAMV